MNFIDIFSEGRELKNPIEAQELRAEIFEKKFDSIAKNNLRLWNFDREIQNEERKRLLGVCPSWNRYDLYLLDCINNSSVKNEIIEVLNLDAFENIDEIKDIFGNIELRQPPVLGIWESGFQLKSLWHWEAKNFLIEKYKFVWSP